MNIFAEYFLYYCLAINLLRTVFGFGYLCNGTFPYTREISRGEHGFRIVFCVLFCFWIAAAFGWILK